MQRPGTTQPPAGKDPVKAYESKPPEWLPPAIRDGDLGYHGFYPPRHGQEEDLLTESNVKSGFQARPEVSVEMFPGKDLALQEIQNTGAIKALEDLMNKVLAKKAENYTIGPATFKMPGRVTLNDAKRHAWVADLANSSVPLHKIRTVPHGYKGHDLLDMLHANKVDIPRAIWYIRVLGANETHGMRNRPNFNPTQYSVEWANNMTTYLKKQLGDIILPSEIRPGLAQVVQVKQTFKSVLLDSDARDRWLLRFSYTLRILRECFAEGMVDHPTFLSWLSQQLGPTCNLAQAGFVARIAEEYLDALLQNRAYARSFIDGSLSKIAEIENSPVKDSLASLSLALQNIVQRSFLAAPDFFVSPRLWISYSTLLRTILFDNAKQSIPLSQQDEPRVVALLEVISDSFQDIQRRNDLMLFRVLPERTVVSRRISMADIQILNSITSTTDMSAIRFLEDPIEDPERCQFGDRLDLLLTWAVTPLHYGDHRPYAVATLISHWRDEAERRATRRNSAQPEDILQERLFHWLDHSDMPRKLENVPAVASLFGELVRQGLFSYGRYVARLIARGGTMISSNKEAFSHHLQILRCIPLCAVNKSLTNQRRVALYGIRARTTPEEAIERDIRQELRNSLPELFGGSPVTFTGFHESHLPKLFSAFRFEQVNMLRHWLLPIVQNFIMERYALASGQPVFLLQSYCVLMEILSRTRCYSIMLDVNIFLSAYVTTKDLLIAMLDTFRRHIDIWTCMDATGTIIDSLLAVHNRMRMQSITVRPLLTLLQDLDNGIRLTAAARLQVEEDLDAWNKELCPLPLNPQAPVPTILTELLVLAGDSDPDAAPNLASALWRQYHTYENWGLVVWEEVVRNLRRLVTSVQTPRERRECALRYSALLWHVDQHLPSGLDKFIAQWLNSPDRSEIYTFEPDTLAAFNTILLDLVIKDALSICTILDGVVFTFWEIASTPMDPQLPQPLDSLVQSVNALVDGMLLDDDAQPNEGEIGPSTLIEVHRLCTRRRQLYDWPMFGNLVKKLPLLVAMEISPFFDPALRESSKRLRIALSRRSDFRMMAYRHVEVVRDAFVDPPSGLPVSSEMLADALKLILDDEIPADVEAESPTPSYDWRKISSQLNPWRFSRTAIEMHLTLQRLANGLSSDETRSQAEMDLQQFTSNFFDRAMSPEETDLAADVLRGINGPVAGKFLDGGLQRLKHLLDCLSLDDNLSGAKSFLSNAGEVLRLLCRVLHPLREDLSKLPKLLPETQSAFLSSLYNKFKQLDTCAEKLSSMPVDFDEPTWRASLSRVADLSIFLSRLLQFDLGFSGALTPATKDVGEKIASHLIQLAFVHAGGHLVNSLVFYIVLDTAAFVTEGLPPDAKTGNIEIFRNRPIPELHGSKVPEEFRTRLRPFLPLAGYDAYVANLAYATRDSSGSIVIGAKVQSRPWDWIEMVESRETRQLVDASQEKPFKLKNSGSLSLDLFNARTNGEVILTPSQHGTREMGELRSLQDGLTTETIFERDWRESRLDLTRKETHPQDASDEEDDATAITGPMARASPAPTNASRSSARGSSSRPSPALRRGGLSTEPIDVDAMSVDPIPPARVLKRKASTASTSMQGDDDDVVLLEGPTTVDPQKAKGKTASKSLKKKK